MGARSKARKRALDILFESELRGIPARETLAARRASAAEGLHPYTVVLVEGVEDHRAEIDQTIAAYSTGWPLQRMPAVDRNLARLGVYELRYAGDVPHAVALSEAVTMARELSTEESPGFLNGLLARIAGSDVAEDAESGVPGQ